MRLSLVSKRLPAQDQESHVSGAASNNQVKDQVLSSSDYENKSEKQGDDIEKPASIENSNQEEVAEQL